MASPSVRRRIIQVDKGFTNKTYLDLDGSDEKIFSEDSSLLSQFGGRNTGAVNFWHKGTVSGRVFNFADGDTAIVDSLEIMIGATTGTYVDETVSMRLRRDSVDRINFSYRAGETAFDDDTWRMITIRIDGVANAVFINGVKQSVSFQTGSASTSEFSNLDGSENILIWGARKSSGSFAAHITAGLNMGSIYTGLTDAQILELYAGGDRHADPRRMSFAQNIIEVWQFGDNDQFTGTNFDIKGLEGGYNMSSSNMEGVDKLYLHE